MLIKRLSNGARSALSNGGTDRYLSVASLWEIAIKQSQSREADHLVCQ